MIAKEKWGCWELSREEIESNARRVGVDPGKLTQDYKKITEKFRREFTKVRRQWQQILEDKIERIAR